MGEMTSLAAAAAIVYKEATGQIASEPALIDQLSAAIVKHVTLFAHKGWGDVLVVVPVDVLEDAVFQEGGALMRAHNVSYTSLCIRESDLPGLVHVLAPLYAPADQKIP